MINPDIFKKFGLPEKEARIYYALLNLGGSFVCPIAQKAGINRGTTYDILESLHKKGLILKYVKDKKFYYCLNQLKSLQNHLKEKQNQIQKQHDFLEKIMPELENLYSTSASKPKVYHYEGIEGIKYMLDDMLNHAYTSDLLCYSSIKAIFTSNLNPRYIKQIIKQKNTNQIPTRVIAQDAPNYTYADYVAKYYKNAPPKAVPKFKVAPSNLKHLFKNEINIYGYKLSIMNLQGPEYFGVIIDNQDIAETQRAIFKLLWQNLK